MRGELFDIGEYISKVVPVLEEHYSTLMDLEGNDLVGRKLEDAVSDMHEAIQYLRQVHGAVDDAFEAIAEHAEG